VKVLAAASVMVLLLALVISLHFVRGGGSFSVSITPLHASIDLGESVEFTSTVTGDVIPSEYQWFLNGTAFAGATSTSWTFTPSANGVYSIYLMAYLSVTNSTGNETQTEAQSRHALVMVGSQSLTGILGYPLETDSGTTVDTQYAIYGSRFILNVEANFTSMSCLMGYWLDSTNPNPNYRYSFAIYRDDNGTMGSLVSQTVQGTITINTPNTVLMWLTLKFPSVVHLAPGAYWLMEVNNSTGQMWINTDPQVIKTDAQDTKKSIGGSISSMTFPASLPHPPDPFNHIFCIYASWDVSFSARLSEGKNVFAVASNSTVSSLAYNSTGSELSFTVSGSSGTTGYTEVFISQALLQDPSLLTVFIDGEQTNFTSTSVYDFWALHFIYSHSTHNVAISIQSNAIPESPTPSPPPTSTIPTPTPMQTTTPTPNYEPKKTEQFEVILGVAIAVAVIGAGLGLLIYLIERK
jgi:hypothetical protein